LDCGFERGSSDVFARSPSFTEDMVAIAMFASKIRLKCSGAVATAEVKNDGRVQLTRCVTSTRTLSGFVKANGFQEQRAQRASPPGRTIAAMM
jgi:hypothetical protein